MQRSKGEIADLWRQACKHPRFWVIVSVVAIILLSYAGITGYLLFFTKHTATISQSHKSKTVPETGTKPDASKGDTPGGDTNTNQPASSDNEPQIIVPGQILNLTDWKLTLPISASNDGSPQEIKQPRLSNYVSAAYFRLSGDGGVVFQAPVGGVTTSGSKYPRSELREMTDGGSKQAAWSGTSGTHTMVIRQAITHLPAVKSQVVAGQIHDATDYIMLIRLEGKHLFVQADDKNVGTLDDNYALGTVFTVKVVAEGGRIAVFYNDVQKVDYAKNGSGFYFKAGCYTQSNPSKGDSPADYGQVVIYGLQVSHG